EPACPLLAGPAPEPCRYGGLLLYVLDQRLLGPVARPASERAALPCCHSYDAGLDCRDADWQSLCAAHGVSAGIPDALGEESVGVGGYCDRTDADCLASLYACAAAPL